MSPLRQALGRTSAPAGDLRERTDALSSALASGGKQLDPGSAERAAAVVGKVGERTSLAGEHTVVALAGATGSGKSSLFNALVGAEVAKIGARRPTTSRPTAAVWGDTDAGELLDWLKVDARHLVRSGGGTSGTLDGLVLLDLPDFDSREVAHRIEAERLLELVDVFVWVTDPQKYADARLHDDYVRLLAQHESVTLAVLNQSDRLPPDAVAACLADLHRLLARDGIEDATVLACSTRTGAGINELQQRIRALVAERTASRERLTADVLTVAADLRRDLADSEAAVDRLPRKDLETALARAAGVPVVLDAVGRDYRRSALARSGWLFTRWIGRRGPNPLRRLRLDPSSGPPDGDAEGAREILQRSSIQAPSMTARSGADVATRAFVRSAAVGLPGRWALAVEDAVESRSEALPDALDQAVLRTPLRLRRPAWWYVANVLQWLLGITAVAGALWLGGLYALGLLALPRPETPTVGIVPVPTLLLIGGALAGMLLAVLARWFARIGARRRKTVVRGRLRRSIAEVASTHVVAPIAEVLERHRRTRDHLERASR